jgi:hypothetical protein
MDGNSSSNLALQHYGKTREDFFDDWSNSTAKVMSDTSTIGVAGFDVTWAEPEYSTILETTGWLSLESNS